MTKIYPEGRIIDPRYNWMYEQDLKELIQKATVKGTDGKRKLLEENQQLIGEFIHDARLGKTLKNRAKKKIGRKRLIKYVQDLKKLDGYFNKPLNQVTVKDMECFVSDLEEGAYTSTKGRAYAKETQVAIKHIIRKFYTWLLDDKNHLEELTGWFDTSTEVKDKPYLLFEEIELMASRMVSNNEHGWIRNRALLMVLADSGVRADELGNTRLKHVTKRERHLHLRIEYSKTKKRTIALTFSQKYLEEWLAIHPTTNQLAQLFPMSYSAITNVLKRSGKRIGKKVTAHTMRRSSATYWAAHLTPYLMCSRFGWSMNSKQPARYIQQAGIDQKEFLRAANKMQTSRDEELKQKNTQLEQEIQAIKQQLNNIQNQDQQQIKKIIEHVKKTGWSPEM